MGKISYSIDTGKNVIYTKVYGNINLKDVENHIQTIQADPNYKNNLQSISDITEAELELSFIKIHGFVNLIKSYAETRQHYKWAFVVGNLHDLGAIKMFIHLIDSGRFTIEFFITKEEAENWIKE
jgi:hypothetical protein